MCLPAEGAAACASEGPTARVVRSLQRTRVAAALLRNAARATAAAVAELGRALKILADS